jgi:hypothetical protein
MSNENEYIHIDQLLTNMATRYKVSQDVADFIAPPFKVIRFSDKYAEYDKSTYRIYNNKIGGRQVAKEISYNVISSPYICEEYSLSKFISNKARQNADKPINVEYDGIKALKDAQMIAREKRVADIAGNASIVTQTVSAGGDWDTVASGTPIADIRLAMATVFSTHTIVPNAIMIPVDVALQTIGTDEYRDYFKYNGASQNDLFNIVSGLRNLGLEPMLAGMFGANTAEIGTSNPGIETIWSDSVLVFHREVTPTLETRTFMYSPFTVKDEIRRIEGSTEQKQRGVLFDIREEIDELLVDATGAYLITNTL